MSPGSYFFLSSGTAPLMPFIPTYAKQLGVSLTGVGYIYSLLPFIGLLAKPFFGVVADKFRIGKIIFMSAITLTAIFFASICLIPGKPSEASLDLDLRVGLCLLKTCNVTDNCTAERINLNNDKKFI